MKKLYLLMMLVLAGIVAEAQTSVWDGSRKLWTRGTGTQTDPYLIESAENLAFLAYMVDKGFETQDLFFRLTTDIDLNGSEDQPWTPIGRFYRGFDEDGCDRGNTLDYGTPTFFSGHFDGGNHTISNLYVVDGSGYAGMFGYADSGLNDESAVIENIEIANGYISGSVCGGIVGRGGKLTVQHCRNAAVIEGHNVGGIVGEGGSVVLNCSNVGALSGTNVGGIVGGITGIFDISECFNEGDITATRIAGGIIGGSRRSTVVNCYNTGNVTAFGDISAYYPAAGGLVAITAPDFEMESSYNVGEVAGNHHVGCLLGYHASDNVSIENCYYLNICEDDEFGISMDAEAMRAPTFVNTLNQGGDVWGMDVNHTNDGFPVLTRTDLAVEEYAEDGVVVFPNPTRGNVKVVGLETVSIMIYNVLGQCVRTIGNSNEINFGDLPEGVYLLRVTDAESRSHATRVLVSR